MKSGFLLTNKVKNIGWIVLIPSSIIGLLITIYDYSPAPLDFKVPALFINELTGETITFGFVKNNLLNEIIGTLIIISSILVAFSKEKIEDEYLSKIRLESLAWAVYFNQALLLISMFFIYDLSFLWVMIFNMFTILWFFIIRFNWLKGKLNRHSGYGE